MAAAGAAAAAALVAGCGSSGTSASSPSPSGTVTTGPATTTNTAICTQWANFQTALRNLTSINVVQQGTNGVKSAADDVRTQFDNLRQSASGQYAPQVDALQTAVSNLDNVVKNLGNQPSLVQAGKDLAAAVGQVSTSAKALGDAVKSTCPSGTPTETGT